MSKDLDLIRKKLGHCSMAWEPETWLNTGDPDLNKVVGHRDKGIPYGRLTELSGLESHGKTALALTIAALAQLDGARIIWTDVENSWDPEWAKVRGLDPSKVELIQPYVGTFGKEKEKRLATAQELCGETEALIEMRGKFRKQLVVVDSLASLLTEGESAAGIEDQNMRTRMDLPMFLGSLLRRWVGHAQVYNAHIILINQLRQNPLVKFGSPWYTPGGNAPRFYSHIRLRVRKTGMLKETGKIVGVQGILKATKNKAGGEEGAEIGYKIFKQGPIEFCPAKYVAFKKEED